MISSSRGVTSKLRNFQMVSATVIFTLTVNVVNWLCILTYFLLSRFCELITMMLQGEEKAPIEVHVTLSPQHVEIDLSEGIWLKQFGLICQTRLYYLSYKVISCGCFCSNCSIPSRWTLYGYPRLMEKHRMVAVSLVRKWMYAWLNGYVCA